MIFSQTFPLFAAIYLKASLLILKKRGGELAKFTWKSLKLTLQNATERTKFQFDPGTTAAEILTALNAGELEMCVQAKDSSRQFSSRLLVLSLGCHESGISSAFLAQMKSDRGDEDRGYCNSISLIAEAVCLIRFSRQYGFFWKYKATFEKYKGTPGRNVCAVSG